MNYKNIGRMIKKSLSRSLSSKIDLQKSWHRRNQTHMYNSILLRMSYDNSGPFINAILWSDYFNPNRIAEGKDVSIFKRPIDSFIEGVNQITIEVSKAKNSHPELYYFRSTSLMKNDLKEYLSRLKKGGDALCSPRIEEILKNGNTNIFKNREKLTHLHEIYVNGSWSITDKKPWVEHELGYDYD